MRTRWKCLLVGVAIALGARIAEAADAEHQHSVAEQGRSAEPIEGRGPIVLSPTAQVAVGMQTQLVTRERLERVVRVVGSVTTDQTRETDVRTRINGWVERIHVDYVGKSVRKGDPLYDLYSPDLISTQNEYLDALKRGSMGDEAASAALTRLRLWGVADKEVQKLTTSRKPLHSVTFYAPANGIVVRKAAVQGSYLTPEAELYYLADLSTVWLQLTLYEADVSLINIGDQVSVSLPYDPERHYSGEIGYIFPEIEAQTRTTKARVELVNDDQFLRPGMFVDAEVRKVLPAMLVVPADAVLETGLRHIAFVKEGDEALAPRELQLGVRVGEKIAILSGLKEGESVVVSASFLIDAESRLQAALQKGKASTQAHGGHGRQ